MPQKVGGHGYAGSRKPRRQRIGRFGITGPAFVQAVINDSAGGSSSRTFTVTVTTKAGNAILLWGRVGTGDQITAISDTKGNTWSIDAQGTSAQTNSLLASVIITTPLVNGDVISLTCSSTHANKFAAAEFSGLAVMGGRTVVDQAANVHGTASGLVTVATLVNAAQGGDLVACSAAGSTNTGAMTPPASDPDSGGLWTDLVLPSGGGTDAVWQTAPATAGLYSAAWTAGTSNADACIVAYAAADTWLGTSAMAISLSDVAAEADDAGGISVVATADLEDVAAEADDSTGIAVSEPVSLADAAAATDAFLPAAAVPLPDAGAAIEAIAETVTFSVADVAGAADSLAVAAAVPVADVAGAADSIATTQPKALADVAGAADAVQIAATVPVADAAGVTDRIVPAAALSLADSAGATELQVIGITQAEQAAAVDSLAVAATVTLADAGGAADANAVGIPQADAAGAADSLAVTVAAPLADAAGSADQISQGGSSSPVLNDLGAAADQIAATVATPLADAAGQAEHLVPSVTLAVADAAGAADSITPQPAVPVADVAAARDALAVTASLGLADAGAVLDALSASALVVFTDAAGTADVLTLPSKQLGLSDAAATADTISVVIGGQGNTGAVTWEAGPQAPRWRAIPAELRWEAGTASRWQTGVVPARWQAGPASSRWRIIMAKFDPISAGSKVYVNALWTTDLAGTVIDPTSPLLTVQFAFPVSSGDESNPALPVTWYAGSWLAGTSGKGFIAQCLVGPGGGLVTLTAGVKYDVWSQILGSPEQPREFVGVQPVTN
jgi:hypothetical protein